MSEERIAAGGMGGAKLIAVALALVIAGGGSSYYFYNQYQRSREELKQTKAQLEQTGQVNTADVVGKVSQLMELPTEETPTVATIRDAEKLKDHPFLGKGQSGDQLLIYTGAKVVVMYRPSTNKIVAVGTVTIQQQGEAGQATPVGGQATPVPTGQ